MGERDRAELARVLGGLERPVPVVLYGSAVAADVASVEATRRALRELAAASPRVRLEERDREADAARAAALDVSRAPTILVGGEAGERVRFVGAPSGREFAVLVEALLDAGGRGARLPAPVAEELARVGRPVRLAVLVTPGCPSCPRAVRAAHRLALASARVRAEMVNVAEFPEIAIEHGVREVPHTLIDGRHAATGAVTELALAREAARLSLRELQD